VSHARWWCCCAKLYATCNANATCAGPFLTP
jgi:hypothetical protein